MNKLFATDEKTRFMNTQIFYSRLEQNHIELLQICYHYES